MAKRKSRKPTQPKKKSGVAKTNKPEPKPHPSKSADDDDQIIIEIVLEDEDRKQPN